ncbi:helix-turn-helix transcriptional regulator [Hymenobacter sp. BT186]|uniref:Helix-turn-helix transcriptional regulator n=1 Tax=Hymenobacter telluris TaxID=2816474 RepID=A0A939JA12_9BACT|nr:response regulator transcription factor [Hymenobacter telluris]MBO0357611.1 helix-turn-helix transcriptional regulator [Hymenobacter telluris]MBW3373637.1 helix-turn-helix transcriptional regulator [Hymenobacter norwichensis]
MKKAPKDIRVLSTVTDYTRFFGLPAPAHPLLTIINLAEARQSALAQGLTPVTTPIVQQFYTVALKRGLNGPLYYGHQSYDFKDGVLFFLAPGQVFAADATLDTSELSGWLLVLHPDLLSKYPLGKKIASYGFFSYEVHEALHLSEKEETVLNGLMQNIESEYERPIDAFSEDVLISQLELLLTYANRFYHRQFLTRRSAEHDLLSRFEELLTAYFSQEEQPLPTVQYFADALHVSPAYLSDMLRTLTGQNTQQHIHHALIEKAKRLLLSTSLTINETAFQLGFEYPQYFSRLFKSKTGLTPAAFRFSVH